jgi:phosphoserine aminotransferase
MNVTFRLADESLEETFLSEVLAHDLGGLKGHRSVGGCRASLYNATSLEMVQALVSFMADFERKYG